MGHRGGAVALGFALLSGCAIAEQDFPDVYAGAVCSKLKKCDRADFDESYESMSDCEANFIDAADAAGDFLQALGLDYNEENARDCVQAVRGAECEGFGETVLPDACDDVWD